MRKDFSDKNTNNLYVDVSIKVGEWRFRNCVQGEVYVCVCVHRRACVIVQDQGERKLHLGEN